MTKLAKLYETLFFAAIGRCRRGRLRVELPDGRRRHAGAADAPEEAVLLVRRDAFFRRCVLRGDIGFGDAYAAGDFDTPDLLALLGFFQRNAVALPGAAASRRAAAGFDLLQRASRLGRWLRRNTRRGSARNIEAHYDLGNAFYERFLDASMTYSSAVFPSPDASLEEGQEEKYRLLGDKLGLRPGLSLLEVGCGWGGFAVYAAKRRGCRVTALTLSPSQRAYARERVEREGLQDLVSVNLRDYRDIQGAYDRIVAIEMIEAVGQRYLPAFFAALAKALKPGGAVALQAILCPDPLYRTMSRRANFIQARIFPGSHLPSLGAIQDAAARRGLGLTGLESIGAHYARTLRLWRERFAEAADELGAEGFDGRFARLWTYYLAYCETGFASRNVNAAQLVLARPNETAFPWEARLAPARVEAPRRACGPLAPA